MNEALRVAFPFPGVVNIDVNIPGIAHPARRHGVGLCPDGGIVNLSSKVIPAKKSRSLVISRCVVISMNRPSSVDCDDAVELPLNGSVCYTNLGIVFAPVRSRGRTVQMRGVSTDEM